MESEPDDDAETYGSQPASERIWLHPSEMGSLLPPAPTGGRPRRPPPTVPLTLVSGMVGAALAVGILVLAGALDRHQRVVVERVAGGPVYDLGEPEGVAQVAAAVAPAIVGLRATAPSGERFGSGVVFRSDGHVVTNHHLVDGATSIEVTGADGRSYSARHTGSDPETDLAVIALDHAGLEPAVLGSARALRVGQTAVVVGAPAGPQGSPSVTAGVIAGLGQVVEVAGRPLYDLISTDAMVGPRASGGPLVDGKGAVVGITTRASTGGLGEAGLGLVIPIDRARQVADQLIAEGRVAYPWLGVSGTDLDPWTAKEYGVGTGTLVRQVEPESPAERGGVKVQDVVTAVEAAPISTMHELTMLVRRHEPGDQIKLTVVRSGAPRTVKVRLDQAPNHP
ncbi:MAG: S1C family serine protease [Actinomycetota bacterium]|nr:S1C family serine protease [Actinomycetota bacterium]